MIPLLQRPAGRVAGRTAIRFGRLSGVWRPRTLTVTLIGVVLVLLAAAANIGRGDFPISLGEVLAVLVGGGADAQRFIVLELRLPRTLVGILVGAALGMSGAITQTLARNPLASPDILGVTHGAGAAAVLVIVLGGTNGTIAGTLGSVGLPIAALIGGIGTATVVYTLSYRRGIEGYRLVLVGVGVGAVAAAITSWLLVVAEVHDAARAVLWLTGSLNARGWEHAVPVGLALLVLVPIALLLASGLDVLQFGDVTARGLGMRFDLLRGGLVLLAVALAAVATASAGPIVFVALVVPQICLRLAGGGRPPLLASAVYGALLTVGADLIARTAFGVELPVGIVTAVLGAPYLLYLLARRNRGVSA